MNHAAMNSEQDVETALDLLLDGNELPLFAAVRELAIRSQPNVPNIQIDVPDLCSYDELLTHMLRAAKEIS